MRQKLIDLTCRLIEFPSITSDLNECQKIIDFCAQQLSHPNIHLTTFNSNGHPSLIATTKTPEPPEYLLYSHIDVVPAESDQFTPKIVDDKIVGRGSGDMKSAAAASILAILHIAESHPTIPLAIMLVTDEETGGKNGAAHIVPQLNYLPKLVIIPDSSSHTGEIITSQKGITHINLQYHGVAAHGSRPHLGENVIEKFIADYQKIQELPYIKNEADFPTTLNLGTIKAGEQINQVPDYLTATLDLRYKDPAENKRFLNDLKNISRGTHQITADTPPYICDLSNQEIKRFIAITEKVIKKQATYKDETGGSDAHYFQIRNIPTIVTGIDKGNAHAPEEWCCINDLENFYNILIEFLTSK